MPALERANWTDHQLRDDARAIEALALAFMDPTVLEDMEETTLPTEEGLYLRTADWWNQAGFLALTGDELAGMLPSERGYVLGGPETLERLVGGLPTRADCARAFSDERVRAWLVRVCSLEIPLLALDLETYAPGSPGMLARESMREAFTAAEYELMAELERASGYAHWRLLHGAFRAWCQ